MRVVFIGTGEIGLPALEWLIQTPEHELVGVITQPDKPVGRKLVLTPPAVKLRALAAGLPVLQPERLKHELPAFADLKPDIAVVIAYGQILNPATLAVPPLGCINVHASLLPKYRGAAPIQAAIYAGETVTGVTLMHIDSGLDSGDIILTEEVPILPTDTGGSLHDKLAAAAPAALQRALHLLATGQAPRTPQDHSHATHMGKLRREDGALDWSLPAAVLERRIRGSNPWPGSFTTLPDSAEPLKVHAARVVEAAEACPVAGTVVAASGRQGLVIATGKGLLELLEVQAQGGKRLQAKDYLSGHPLPVGGRLK